MVLKGKKLFRGRFDPFTFFFFCFLINIFLISISVTRKRANTLGEEQSISGLQHVLVRKFESIWDFLFFSLFSIKISIYSIKCFIRIVLKMKISRKGTKYLKKDQNISTVGTKRPWYKKSPYRIRESCWSQPLAVVQFANFLHGICRIRIRISARAFSTFVAATNPRPSYSVLFRSTFIFHSIYSPVILRCLLWYVL